MQEYKTENVQVVESPENEQWRFMGVFENATGEIMSAWKTGDHYEIYSGKVDEQKTVTLNKKWGAAINRWSDKKHCPFLLSSNADCD